MKHHDANALLCSLLGRSEDSSNNGPPLLAGGPPSGEGASAGGLARGPEATFLWGASERVKPKAYLGFKREGILLVWGK